jgi:hypothetical protein
MHQGPLGPCVESITAHRLGLPNSLNQLPNLLTSSIALRLPKHATRVAEHHANDHGDNQTLRPRAYALCPAKPEGKDEGEPLDRSASFRDEAPQDTASIVVVPLLKSRGTSD